MQKRFLYFLFLLATVVGTYNPADAQVWDADPNAGDFGNYFRLFQNGNPPPSSASDACKNGRGAFVQRPSGTDGVSGRSWKIVKPRDTGRAEFSRTTGSSQNFEHPSGRNYYYSWRWRVDVSESSWANSGAEVTVFQWKTEGSGGSQNYPLNMEYVGNKLKLFYFAPCKIGNNLSAWNSCSGSIFNRRVELYSATVEQNEWVEIVLRVQKGENESGSGSGKVQLWIDGQLKTLNGPNGSGRSIELKTDDADNQNVENSSVYPKWGIYNGASCNYSMTTWINSLRVYSTHTEALQNLEDTRPSGSNWSDISSGWYRIVPRSNTSQTLTVDTDQGDNLVQWPWQSTDNQRFYVTRYSDGSYTIESSQGKALDVSNSSTANGTNIIAYPTNYGTNQFFKFKDGIDGYISVRSKLNLDKGLAIYGNQVNNNRASIILWDYWPNNNHLFKFIPVSAPSGGNSGGGGSSEGGSSNQNILLGKSPASFNSGIYGTGYELNKANDGSGSTRWASGVNGGDADIISFDLGRTYNISQMRIAWETSRGVDFGFCYYDSYYNSWYYMDQGVFSNNNQLSNTANVNVDARYIGVYVTKASNGSFVSAWEIEAYGQAKNAPTSGLQRPQGIPIVLDQSRSFEVYPNPVSDRFTIDLAGLGDTEVRIEIMDIAGRVVYQTRTRKDRVQLDKGTTFNAGVYVVNITDGTGHSYVKKLVVR